MRGGAATEKRIGSAGAGARVPPRAMTASAMVVAASTAVVAINSSGRVRWGAAVAAVSGVSASHCSCSAMSCAL